MAVATIWHDAFYRFVGVTEPAKLLELLETVCSQAGVLGSILVANEGINGMLAGTESQLRQVRDVFEADLRFQKLFYKRTACSAMPFKRLKIKLKDELVPLGIAGIDSTQTGVDVAPEAWRKLLQEEDVVLIDNRNSFEYQLGHFTGAIDPGVNNFRDVAAYIREHLAQWQDKKLAMYCTGGIRCEKTSAWLRGLGLRVYQLEGGILNYFAQLPDAEQDFIGSCFVFDDRVALDTTLQETGQTREAIENQVAQANQGV
jgi:UPF0176 protein